MARRRMFSLDIVDTDAFLDMPSSAQNLYFHLGMRADDEGFISNPKRITALIGSSPDDLKLLITKNYIIPFKSGVCVVRDWRINNYIQADRRKDTLHFAEKAMLSLDNAAAYTLLNTACIQNASKLDTQDSIGKTSTGEERIDKGREQTRKRFTPPTVDEVAAYCQERGNKLDPERFIDFYSAKGWCIGKNRMKDWRAAVRTWERRDDFSSVQNKPMATADRLALMIQEGVFGD